MMGTILAAVTMWVFGDAIGVAPVLAALMGLCGLLFTGGCLGLGLGCAGAHVCVQQRCLRGAWAGRQTGRQADVS